MSRMGERLELVGDVVTLRPTVPADARRLVAMRRTDEVRRWWRGHDIEAEVADDLADDGLVQLTIEADGRIVGLVQFAEEDDPDYRHAALDIYLDPAVHRRGYATDALRTLTDYLFDQRAHHRLTIDPAADNHAAIGCYAAVGFRRVGIMRAYERSGDGSWKDGLLMEMLAGDLVDGTQP